MSNRTTESDSHGDSEQQLLTTTVEGHGFIWRPWFATLGLKLHLSQASTDTERDDSPQSQRTEDRIAAGEARMNLFPRSRFPLDLFVDIFDSRIETNTVGVDLDDITTLRRERAGATQRYTTRSGDSSYTLHGVRTNLYETDGAEENTEDVALSGTHRFDAQTFEYGMNGSTTLRRETDLQREDRLRALTLRHQAQPGSGFSIESVFDAHRDEQELDLAPVAENTSRSVDNFLTWRPVDSKWTVRTHLGGQTRDSAAVDVADSETETYVGSAAVSYEFSRALRFTGDVGTDGTRVDDQSVRRRTFENASLVYAPAPVTLEEGLQYAWGASGTIGNSDATDEQSIQSLSVALRHSLNKIVSNGEGRTVTSSVSQSGTQLLDSEVTDLFTLTHQGSAAVHWSGASTSSLIRANVSDARTRGTEGNALQSTDVDRIIQTADVQGSQEYAVSRFSSWDGHFRVGETREYDHEDETRRVSGGAGVGYTYHHVFNVDRLRFRSRLEYAASSTETQTPTAFEEEEEERASWDNRLDYIVGLLTLSARRTTTEINDARTVTTVLSASRVF